MKETNHDGQKGVINILEGLLDALKSNNWRVDESSINIENRVNEWEHIVDHKNIDIKMRISPTNYCTIGSLYINFEGDSDE